MKNETRTQNYERFIEDPGISERQRKAVLKALGKVTNVLNGFSEELDKGKEPIIVHKK